MWARPKAAEEEGVSSGGEAFDPVAGSEALSGARRRRQLKILRQRARVYTVYLS